jgi:hypothetical protein
MNKPPPGLFAHLFHARFFTPKDFVLRAGLIAVLFLVAHLAGLREFTTFISGTSARPEWGWPVVALLGTAYLLLYFGCILAVPVLLLGAAILKVTERLGKPTHAGPAEATSPPASSR